MPHVLAPARPLSHLHPLTLPPPAHSHLLNAATAEAVAVVITSAQKSAPVAVTLISYATTNVSQQGLLAIPSIVGQLSQIFIGAAFVPAVLARTKAAAAREEAERERREKEAGVQDQAQGGGNGDDGDEEAGPFDRGATATAAAAEATTGPVVNVSPARSGGAPTALVCINNLDNERPLAHSGLSSGLSAEVSHGLFFVQAASQPASCFVCA